MNKEKITHKYFVKKDDLPLFTKTGRIRKEFIKREGEDNVMRYRNVPNFLKKLTKKSRNKIQKKKRIKLNV